MTKYTEELREKTAHAVMSNAGFNYTGTSTLVEEAASGNPRVRQWVLHADHILGVIFPRTRLAQERARIRR